MAIAALHGIFNRLICLKYKISVRLSKNDSAYLLGIPSHPNLGDQAQSMCTCEWIAENYPLLTVRQFSSAELEYGGYRLLREVADKSTARDMIFFQSGYNTTDLYLFEEKMHRRALELLHHRRITVMPQTVYFRDADEKKKCAAAYERSDNDVLFLARDGVSYGDAKSFIPDKCRVTLFPDIVTTLIGSGRFSPPGEHAGILLCVRSDRESVITDGDRGRIVNDLSAFDHVDVTDTNADAHHRAVRRDREKYVCGKIAQFARYRVIVTDRYHGMIFALAAGVPVIVLETSDHKLSSGLEWFTERPEYDGYITICRDMTGLSDMTRAVLDRGGLPPLGDSFKKEYYDRLAEIIGRDD